MKKKFVLYVLLAMLSIACSKNVKEESKSSSTMDGTQKAVIESKQSSNNAESNENLRKLVSLMQVEEQAKLNIDHAIASMRRFAPSISAEFWQRFKKEADTSAYVDMAVEVYPKYLSDSDIKGLVAFYESKVGKKMVKVQSALSADTFTVMQQWGKEIGIRIRAKLDNTQAPPATPVEQNNSTFAQKTRKMMELSGMGNLAQTIIDQMIANLKPVRPDIGDEIWDGVRKEIQMAELVERIIPIMRNHYSEDDMDGLIAFYKTEVGKTLVSVQPKISGEMMARGKAWGAKLGAEIEEKMKEELKNSSPQDTQAP